MAEHPPRPGYRFPAPVPKEALVYFRVRDFKVGFDYRDVWLQEHARAFTVAKVMEIDLLKDIHAAIDKAIAEGTTLAQFQKDLTPLLQRKGWWGKKVMIDPETGKPIVAQLGSPRRLRTIYRANLRAARAAGIWDRAQRTKKTLPYFLYELGPSKKHRDKHRAWAGTLLPVDDPWWDDHFPPNGWGCKCRVRQVSRREAERLGGPTAPPPRNEVMLTNPRIKKQYRVDDGLDPAWASNPGKDWGRVMSDRVFQALDGTAPDFTRAAVRNIVDSPMLDGLHQQVAAYKARFPEEAEAKKVAILDQAANDRIGYLPAAMFSDRARRKLTRPPGEKSRPARVVRLSAETLLKQLKRHPDIGVRDYRRLPELIEHDSFEKIDDLKMAFFRHYDHHWRQAVVKQTTANELYLVSYHKVSRAQVPEDILEEWESSQKD